MDDGRDDERNRDRSHDESGDDGDGGNGENGGGPDTRFLQLEMSELLFSEAEGVTRDAFRALLLEAAKERFNERFGEQIRALASTAVDEWMADMSASLAVETLVRARNERHDQARRDWRESVDAARHDPPGKETHDANGPRHDPRRAGTRRSKNGRR